MLSQGVYVEKGIHIQINAYQEHEAFRKATVIYPPPERFQVILPQTFNDDSEFYI